MLSDEIMSDLRRLEMLPRAENGTRRKRPTNLNIGEGASSKRAFSTPKVTAVQLQKRLTFEQIKELVYGQGHSPYTLRALWDCSLQSATTVLKNINIPCDLRSHPWKARHFFELCYSWDLNAAEVLKLMSDSKREPTQNPVYGMMTFKGVTLLGGWIRKPHEFLSRTFIDEALRADFDMQTLHKLTNYSVDRIKEALYQKGMGRQYDQLMLNSQKEWPVKRIPEYMQYKFFQQRAAQAEREALAKKAAQSAAAAASGETKQG